MLLCIIVVLLALIVTFTVPELNNIGDLAHPYIQTSNRETITRKVKNYNLDEETSDYWFRQAQRTLYRQVSKTYIKGTAKNVILFLGDGMSIATLTAARAYLGQKNNKTGEETRLSFERFPFVGLSKTYCVNTQVADSACSATAYLSGVKANIGTIGVTAAVSQGDCAASQNPNTRLESIARSFQKDDRSTGFVTTTRVTHASPAGVYANTAHRDWESDSEVKNSNNNPYECPDIAHQLIHGPTGKNLRVILGGGRAKFLPATQYDNDGVKGNRSDGRNLIGEWLHQKRGTRQFVWNRTGLQNVSTDTTHLLGLFSPDHVPYNLDRNEKVIPSLAEMAEVAIKILSQNRNGYFLFIEGGRIDHAHHDSRARKALDETVEFHKAVEAVVRLTNREETLIIVTSDHSHTMTINGYPPRGNDILGVGGTADDGIPYTTLTYSNGPGYRVLENGQRHNVLNDNLGDDNYTYPSGFPTDDETHGADDVAIFGLGPWAHLMVGVLEQNVIAHVMAFASCVGTGITACDANEFVNFNKKVL